ncbi:peptidylprolyl isomerase [Conexibacter woesei]|uniref:Peptidyl-prolyl cis-trans isomerase n=1 Tax=Conexibacter woesei (strain DSM 14684 / CCUG 47730 / CIP 108061 / JCM 11494 / NBRC 100937 / ID131577) TaxID=469383 RepID=D3FEW8_CONWI|nr:peptidylprolyl isomerase [Conexibacter woesei]ADB51685.1 peptidyl-prolyl cis-trans isomerase cyclophilin type [Conexibacter woesei DSM 14684]
MRRTFSPLVAVLIAAPFAVLAGCGSDGGKKQETTAAVCRKVAAPEAKSNLDVRKPVGRLSPTVDWRAIVTTNCGTFTITLDAAASPRTTASFARLARAGFYDDLTFHRIAPGFVIQGGDPLGNGLGGPGYAIAEAPPRTTRYTKGVVAMAKTATDPDGTSGSQFFIVTGDDAQLPPQYALLGRVTSGLDVVDRIDQRPLRDTDPQGSAPVDPILIERVAIRQG